MAVLLVFEIFDNRFVEHNTLEGEDRFAEALY